MSAELWIGLLGGLGISPLARFIWTRVADRWPRKVQHIRDLFGLRREAREEGDDDAVRMVEKRLAKVIGARFEALKDPELMGDQPEERGTAWGGALMPAIADRAGVFAMFLNLSLNCTKVMIDVGTELSDGIKAVLTDGTRRGLRYLQNDIDYLAENDYHNKSLEFLRRWRQKGEDIWDTHPLNDERADAGS